MSVPERDTTDNGGSYPTRDTSTVSTIPRTSDASIRPSLTGGGSYPLRLSPPNVQTLANTTTREGFTATYGNDPFSILADLFLRTSTGFDPAPPANSGVIAVDPGVSGGGNSTILIMLILGVAAVAVWYFYFR
jgi:hypothetical protein